MNNALIIQSANIDGDATYCNHVCMSMYLNKDYAIKNKIDYSISFKSIKKDEIALDRVNMVLSALKNYEYVCWLDADSVIVSGDDFRNIWSGEESFLGFVKYNIPVKHLNTGVFYIRNSTKTIDTITEWISKPFYNNWLEQQTLNDMYNTGKYDTIREIHPKWNDLTYNRYSENPVVLSSHGSNCPSEKYLMMVRDVLESYGFIKKRSMI